MFCMTSYEAVAVMMVGWLVGCFELKGLLRLYFSLYWAVKIEERNDTGEEKCPNSTRTYCKHSRPLPY